MGIVGGGGVMSCSGLKNAKKCANDSNFSSWGGCKICRGSTFLGGQQFLGEQKFGGSTFLRGQTLLGVEICGWFKIVGASKLRLK